MSESRHPPLGNDPDPRNRVAEDIQSLTQEVNEGMKQIAEVYRVVSGGMAQVQNSNESVKQATYEGMVIANGGHPGGHPGSISTDHRTGNIKISTPEHPQASTERSNSIAVQSVAAASAVLINLLWLSYFGADMPTEVYASIPVLIQVLAQASATIINNRKRS